MYLVNAVPAFGAIPPRMELVLLWLREGHQEAGVSPGDEIRTLIPNTTCSDLYVRVTLNDTPLNNGQWATVEPGQIRRVTQGGVKITPAMIRSKAGLRLGIDVWRREGKVFELSGPMDNGRITLVQATQSVGDYFGELPEYTAPHYAQTVWLMEAELLSVLLRSAPGANYQRHVTPELGDVNFDNDELNKAPRALNLATGHYLFPL